MSHNVSNISFPNMYSWTLTQSLHNLLRKPNNVDICCNIFKILRVSFFVALKYFTISTFLWNNYFPLFSNWWTQIKWWNLVIDLHCHCLNNSASQSKFWEPSSPVPPFCSPLQHKDINTHKAHTSKLDDAGPTAWDSRGTDKLKWV